MRRASRVDVGAIAGATVLVAVALGVPWIATEAAREPPPAERGDLGAHADLAGLLALARSDAGDPKAGARAIAALRARGRAPLGPELEAAALDALRRHATADDVDLLIEIALEGAGPAPDDAGAARDAGGEAPRRSTGRAFEEGLVAVLRRDSRAYDDLHLTALECGPLRASLVRAVGRAGDPRGLDWLAGEIGDWRVGDAALLEIERLAPRASPQQAGPLTELLLPLLQERSGAVRTHAARALGSLKADDAVPLLIALLASKERGERRAAHAALRAITGRGLPEDARTWAAWHETETRWLATELPPILERLASDDPAATVADVRALSERGLHRRTLAAELARALAHHPSAPVRAEACRGLARLDAHAQQEALLAAVEDEHEDALVRTAAAEALAALTGLPAPPEPENWRATVESRSR